MNEQPFKLPGQMISSKLDELGWSQRVLSTVLGVSDSSLSKIVAGTQSLKADLALEIGQVLGLEPDELLSLQQQWDLARARSAHRPDPNVQRRAAIYGALPIRDMLKRGWIRASSIRNASEVEEGVLRFFGADSVDELDVVPHAARRSRPEDQVSSVQAAWLRRVQKVAECLIAAPHSNRGLERCLAKLKTLRSEPEAIREVPLALAEAGIRFVVVEALPSSKIDGACMWLDPTTPVIGMSLRFDRIDNFWFVLRHELEHVRLGHGQEALNPHIDSDLFAAEEVSAEEALANAAAAEFCVPQRSMKLFLERKAPLYRDRDLVGFARAMKVHPGLVAGQVQHATGRYDLYRKHLVRVRHLVCANAFVDGWGDVFPVD